MLATILGILKIILIVLLSILGVALTLILLLLLWPFSYRIKGVFRSESNEIKEANGKVNVSFLFHIVSVWAEYFKDEGFDAYIKLFGIKIFDYNKWKEKSERKEEIKNQKEVIAEKDKKSSSNLQLDKEDYENNSYDGNDDFENKTKTTNSKESKKKSSIFDKLKRKKSISFGDFLEESFYKIWDFVDSIPDKIDNFLKKPKDKIDKIVDTIVYYDKLFNKKGTEYVIEFLKKKGIKLFKHLRPKKSKIYMEYGTDNPIAVTKAMEVYALLIPLLPKNSKFIPLYEEEKLVLDIDVKGRFVVGYVGIIGLSIVLNKKVRKFIKLLKRG